MLVRRSRAKGLIIILGLLILGAAGTIILDATGWDLTWVSRCYTAGGARGGWTHSREQPWGALYDYGEIPPLILAVAALALYVAAKSGKARRVYTKSCLVVILTVALGPGLLVNCILKPYWGRPRPADITVMGGTQEYHRVWMPAGAKGGKSFPCGHCSMGFSLASAGAFYPFHPTLAVCALAGGIAYGALLGVTRVIQGGHFPTDVLWAGVLVLMLIAALYYLVLRVPEQTHSS
ncbi:MAG: phosphatase PAP2 family protein [Desulfomonilaceae bacterium]